MTLNAISSNFLGILRYFAFLGEQMFVVDGVTVKNAMRVDLVSCVLHTKVVARLPLR